MKPITKLVSASLCAFSVFVANASVAPSFSSLVVFGDSLSDPGNALFLTKNFPFDGAGGLFLTSQGQNFDPLGRFSNGPTAPEQMASALGLTTRLAWDPLSIGGAINFAVGGALTGSGHLTQGAVPQLANTGVSAQVARYTNAPGFDAASTLFMIQGGGNDIFAANAFAAANDLSFAQLNVLYGAVINSATSNLANSILELGYKGATNILWQGLPDLGLTPLSQAGGPPAMGASSFLTDSFNQLLAQKIGIVNQQLDAIRGFDVNIIGFDTAGLMRAAYIAAPSSFTDPHCVAAGQQPDCAGLFFWDSVHPTTAAHGILANQLLAAVPEPEVWLLMMAGLGLVAFRARRRA